MTAYNANLVGDGTVISPNHSGVQVFRKRVDLAVQAALAGVSSFGSADTLGLLELPAGTLVMGVHVNVITAEGATLTADIGITGTDADGWVDGVDLNATGWTAGVQALTEGTPNTLTGFTGGKLITADSRIDILFNNASADTAVFDVFIVFASLANLSA